MKVLNYTRNLIGELEAKANLLFDYAIYLENLP